MKCPLSITGELTADKEFIGAAADCLKEECAWWDRTAEKCVVLQLAFEIDKVSDRLERIWDKMPHERQFRR
ncbi:unnamed protein product [marine sediment metagenome]|uniref:Uncharacterized protein n=1 Tax=marine sediment metagenome TaxID=412755 RepID=X1S4G4_9ZZZZ